MIYIPDDYDTSQPLPVEKYELYCQALSRGEHPTEAYIEFIARDPKAIRKAAARAASGALKRKPYVRGRVEWLTKQARENEDLLRLEGKPMLSREDILLAYCVKFKRLAVQTSKTTREESDLARALTTYGSEICKLTNAYKGRDKAHEVRLKLRTTPVTEDEADAVTGSADERL